MVAETNCGAVTVRAEEPLTPPSAAVIIVFPALWLIAKPTLLIVAAAVLREVHVATEVRSAWLPSL